MSYPKFSIAPMLSYTDRHFRYLARLISKEVLLYTEMVTTGAILKGRADRFLAYDLVEHPLVLQLGGSDPAALKECAKIAENEGFDAINLNIGCPSPKVQTGAFGAVLMKDPVLVADCVSKMQPVVKIPVTVKTRLGVDGYQCEDDFFNFIETVFEAGCQTFIIHARTADLKNLSPKENRSIPPLQYERVYQLKELYPQLNIVINGEIQNMVEAKKHLEYVDGVMIGRSFYQNPYEFIEMDGKEESPSRVEIWQHYCDYLKEQASLGEKLHLMIKPMMGLLNAVPLGKKMRREISEALLSKDNEKILVLLSQIFL